MHSIWSGSISFGLVNIPVNLYSGSQKHAGVDLDMLHKKDLSPIRYARVCQVDGKEVPYKDIVKGFAYKKGNYVELTPEDFKKADVRKTHTIQIKLFAQEEEIDSRYYDKPYYLEPAKGGEGAYALLREALEHSSKVAVACYVLRERENIGVIRPIGKALVLNQMRFPADLRNPNELGLPAKSKPDATQMKIAIALIDKLSGHFIAEDWHDAYTEELEAIITAKLKGKKVMANGKVPSPTPAKDLMAALKASLEKKK